MSKRSSRIFSVSLALVLVLTPLGVLAQDGPGTIEGVVFNDANQNGDFDAGESGIDGVSVELLDADGETLVDSVPTSGGGLYSFSGLELGDYVVREQDPADHVSTTTNTVAVTLSELESTAAVNFGDAAYADLGQISGFVYDDTDRDGEWDPGEATIPGVEVNLFGIDGEVIETATTDITTGEYVLTLAIAGANTVQEIDPPDYYSVTPNTVEVTLASPGDTVSGIDFFDFIPAEGEVHRIDLMLMKFFDISLLEFQALREMEGWGYGNIAKAYFIAQLTDTALIDILGMRESMGWGVIMKELLGYAGLKGYNLGLIVSGREVPNVVLKLIEQCEGLNTQEEVQELFAMGASVGSIKQACRLADDFETLVEVVDLLKTHNFKQVAGMMAQGLTDQVTNGNQGNHGPPPCKGKNKYDDGCDN